LKLALLGKNISHSQSPSIYQKLLGQKLTSYELLDVADEGSIPSLDELAQRFEGMNITTPYKRHFAQEVNVTSDIARELGAINALSLRKPFTGTNTDALAVEFILKRYLDQHPGLQIILLGGGVMSKMTELILKKLKQTCLTLTRAQYGDLSHYDLAQFYSPPIQTLIINSCSRSFVFQGSLHETYIFWDYNYKYSPHEKLVKPKVGYYEDGTEMLELQAQEAVRFWQSNKP
jgi:shikimate dehydrogenase